MKLTKILEKKLLLLSYINKISQKSIIFIHFYKFNIIDDFFSINSAHENHHKKLSYLQIIKFHK